MGYVLPGLARSGVRVTFLRGWGYIILHLSPPYRTAEGADNFHQIFKNRDWFLPHIRSIMGLEYLSGSYAYGSTQFERSSTH